MTQSEATAQDARHGARDSGAPEGEEDGAAYARILKSTTLIGMSSAVNILIGMVRTKAMAVLLGPAGFGLLGMYGSLVDVATSFAGMGVNSSGVRQIAEAMSTGQAERIATTVLVLRRTSLLLGVLGAGLLVVLSDQASTVTFGDAHHAGAVALLSLAVLFRLIAAGQSALLQGRRQIADLARIGVYGALLGTIVGIPTIYVYGESGVAASIVLTAAMSLATSWWYVRRETIATPKITFAEFFDEASALLKLGAAFMISGFLTIGAAYLVRLIITREISLEAAGLYSSAWTLGGLYVGYVLQAMGADFYPQLVGLANDHTRCNRLVNDQAQVSLLLAGPGIVATITFAPVVIALFYSAKFFGAIEVLRWICLGMALRVITWPMGYIIVAKNRQLLFLGVDLFWTVVNVLLTWLLVIRFGLTGAGFAFFASYVCHAAVVYPVVRRLSGFRWSSDNLRTACLFLGLSAISFAAQHALPSLWALAIGAVLTLVSGAYSLRVLLQLVSAHRLPKRLIRIFVRLRLLPPQPDADPAPLG